MKDVRVERSTNRDTTVAPALRSDSRRLGWSPRVSQGTGRSGDQQSLSQCAQHVPRSTSRWPSADSWF